MRRLRAPYFGAPCVLLAVGPAARERDRFALFPLLLLQPFRRSALRIVRVALRLSRQARCTALVEALAGASRALLRRAALRELVDTSGRPVLAPIHADT